MKKTILIILEIVIVLIFLRFAFVFFINEIFLINYRNEKYNINSIKILAFANFSESYIYHYNQGNLFYKNGKYNEAINEYNRALEKNIPEKKECSIRINLALAKLQTLGDLKNEDEKQRNIDILKSARSVLCEKGCANPEDNNGHSQEAEKLKQDIDKLLEQLQDKSEEKEDPNNNEQPQEQKEENNKKNDEKKEKLKKMQIESLKQRQEEIDDSEKFWGKVDTSIFYEGKKW